MKRVLPRSLLGLGALLLFWNLGRPALWQDEAETALRAESILETGAPRMTLNGARVTAQPSLTAHEGNAAGVWTWNTWLPAYLVAASFAVLGRTPLAARLPFALAALATLFLFWRLFEEDEDAKRPWAAQAGLALLVLSPAFLLFARQARYYALTALGAVLVMRAWRRMLDGKAGGALALVLALQFLLHSSFAFFAVALAVVGVDALARSAAKRSKGLGVAAAATAALSLPVFWYFRVWDRPGNHAYGPAEALEFLKTFLLWIALFAVPALLPAIAALRKRAPVPVLLGFVLLCGLVAEGFWSRAAAAAAFAWIAAQAALAPPGSLRRLSWLWLAAGLGLLSLSAAEPYGRYLMCLLPPLAYLGGRWLSQAAAGRPAAMAALAVLLLSTNWLACLPLKAAAAIAGPRAPAQTVSGMMRQRLRDVGPRSDLARLLGELARGPRGYVERAAAAIKAGGGGTVFSDADNLSLMFAVGA
ncbi:MAG: hypothetical protein HYZ74_01420, partial [Elusimicrobia bacterium]|nr:hypothetical protein [Elusimicrobiota bacterium]